METKVEWTNEQVMSAATETAMFLGSGRRGRLGYCAGQIHLVLMPKAIEVQKKEEELRLFHKRENAPPGVSIQDDPRMWAKDPVLFDKERRELMSVPNALTFSTRLAYEDLESIPDLRGWFWIHLDALIDKPKALDATAPPPPTPTLVP